MAARGLLGRDLEQVDAVAADDVGRLFAAAKIAAVELVVELALGDPADVAASAGGRAVPSELSRASTANSSPASAFALRAAIASVSGGLFHDLNNVPAKADLTGGRRSPASGTPWARIALRNSGSTDMVLSMYGSLPAGARRPLGRGFVALGTRDQSNGSGSASQADEGREGLLGARAPRRGR